MFTFAGCSLGRTLEQKSDATYVNCIWACFVGFGLAWFFLGSFLYSNMNTYNFGMGAAYFYGHSKVQLR